MLLLLFELAIVNANNYNIKQMHGYSDKQWYIYDDGNGKIDVGIPQMWKETKKVLNKQEVVVAVIDGGMDVFNKSISKQLWSNSKEIPGNARDDDKNGFVDDINGWNFAENNNSVGYYKKGKYELNHATKIAGIICADATKGEVAGVASDRSIKIMPIQIVTNNEKDSYDLGSGTIKNLINGIKYAEEMGADICNISLNTFKNNKQLQRVIKKSSMLFVVSAGNGTGRMRNIDKRPSYPAAYNWQNLITVANIKSNGRLCSNSNYGVKRVDIAVPGTDIYNIDSVEKYSYGTGTSYSTPIVTALAAELYSVNSNMDAITCKKTICETATFEEKLKKKIKNGRIVNCERAIRRGISL